MLACGEKEDTGFTLDEPATFEQIENENLIGEFFVKIDGNRQIVIHILDEKNVRAQLLDLRFKFPNLIR